MARRIELHISNLATTPDQEEGLVDRLWSVVARLYPEADIAAISGADDE